MENLDLLDFKANAESEENLVLKVPRDIAVLLVFKVFLAQS